MPLDLTAARERHRWDVDPAEARAIQDRLRAEVSLVDDPPGWPDAVATVAGVDVGFEGRGDDRYAVARAAVAVLALPSLEVVATSIARRPTAFPYVPGLLSFREIPVLLDALEGLDEAPGALLADGQGVAHPRRLGIASHLGVLTGWRTVGVGKSLLVGRHGPLAAEKGARAELLLDGEAVGVALRTRAGVKPVFVSPGHRASIDASVAIVERCLTRWKLPETTRAAHALASG